MRKEAAVEAIKDIQFDETRILTSTIVAAYSKLRPAEQRVADVVIENIGRAVGASNLELAVLATVSEATVLRFCRAIGCRSLADLQRRLSEN